MTIKRITESMIQVGNILFEYDTKELEWHPVKGNATDNHYISLQQFIATETEEAREFYEGYYNYISHLNEILNSNGICSVQ